MTLLIFVASGAFWTCTFQEGFCGLININSGTDSRWGRDTSNFDWTRRTENTPSEETGPSFDHTRGNDPNGES